MIIQELFKKADVENVFYAYILIRPVFDDLDRHTMQEKAVALKNLREHIKSACNEIATCDNEKTVEPETVFVIGRTRTGWGESYIQDLECFLTKDEDALEAVKKNFTMWDNDGDVKLDYYSVDFVPISALAGYHIAKPSVLEQGIDVCCAVILRELFIWGFSEDMRRVSLANLEKDLKESEEAVLQNRTVSFDEFFEELDRYLFEKATEDEKEHFRLEDEYKKKVEKIEERHMMEIINNDHQRFISMVRDEYTSRE